MHKWYKGAGISKVEGSLLLQALRMQNFSQIKLAQSNRTVVKMNKIITDILQMTKIIFQF